MNDKYFFNAVIELEIQATQADKQVIAELLRIVSNAIEKINPTILNDIKTWSYEKTNDDTFRAYRDILSNDSNTVFQRLPLAYFNICNGIRVGWSCSA